MSTWARYKANMDRTDLRFISRRNLDILDAGFYKKDGSKIDLLEMTTQYLDEHVLLTAPPKETAVDAPQADQKEQTVFRVSRLDSFECAKMVHAANVQAVITVLNFASAKKPGGGFLNGAMAQEEALCYRSNLYASLTSDNAKSFYHYPTGAPITYTNRMIYTGNVSVFRDPGYELCSARDVFLVDVITCAAVNRKICSGPRNDTLANETMIERAWRIVALAATQKVQHLVLGAWGCGVFGNDVAFVTRAFMNAITKDFFDAFKSVSFASPSGKNYRIMHNVVSEYATPIEDVPVEAVASSSAPAVVAPKVLVGGQRVRKIK